MTNQREHCCFDENDRVLYPKPCGSNLSDANKHLRPMIQLMKRSSATDDSADEISRTTTDSSSTATGIDDGDDENNDMKEYPNVLIKRRPTKERTLLFR